MDLITIFSIDNSSHLLHVPEQVGPEAHLGVEILRYFISSWKLYCNQGGTLPPGLVTELVN
jgi:hypothetical protein